MVLPVYEAAFSYLSLVVGSLDCFQFCSFNMGVFQASIEEVALQFGGFKSGLELPSHLLGVELLAGEDIDIDEMSLGEGVDADMALGDKHKA